MLSAPGPSGLCLHASVSASVTLAGNGSSSNGSSDTPKRRKKRPRRSESWKHNQAKAKRVTGKEYTAPSSGKIIPAWSTGPPCTCKKLCFELISNNKKRQLLEADNGLTNKDLQDVHLFGLIASNEIKRRRPRGALARSARRASYTYHVRGKKCSSVYTNGQHG